MPQSPPQSAHPGQPASEKSMHLVPIDLYLPALPALTSGFGAKLSQAQLTLTGMLLAFGCSQMVWGPLSDRIGRRPVLLAGLGLYAVAGVGALLAGSMDWLILWRVLQGAAMGAAVMAGRAIVRDLYAPEQGARILSKALSGLGVIAALSAPVGSWLASAWGWRAALGALAVFGAFALVAVAWRFVETVPRLNPQATQPAVLLRTWGRVLSHPTFWTYGLLATVSYAGLFTFLGSSTFLCRRLLVRMGVQRTVRMAGFITLGGGGLMALLPHLGIIHPLTVLLPYCIFMVGHGIHQPCGQSGAVGPFPDAAGAASALSGRMMMLVAFGVGSWLGWRMDGCVFSLSNGIGFWAVAITTVAWVLVPRFGSPRTPPKRVA